MNVASYYVDVEGGQGYLDLRHKSNLKYKGMRNGKRYEDYPSSNACRITQVI